jgi:hypothetical protein
MIITPETIKNFFLTCFGIFCHEEKEINKKEIEMKPIKKKQKKKKSFKMNLSTIFEE